MELSLVPLICRATSGSVFCSVCELSRTLGHLSADGWSYVPVLLVSCLRHTALELAGCWVEPATGAKMGTSGRAHYNKYSLGLGNLWRSRVLDLVLPLLGPRPDPWPGEQDSTRCAVCPPQKGKENKQAVKQNPREITKTNKQQQEKRRKQRKPMTSNENQTK